jgi:hypothetical protein
VVYDASPRVDMNTLSDVQYEQAAGLLAGGAFHGASIRKPQPYSHTVLWLDGRQAQPARSVPSPPGRSLLPIAGVYHTVSVLLGKRIPDIESNVSDWERADWTERKAE